MASPSGWPKGELWDHRVVKKFFDGTPVSCESYGDRREPKLLETASRSQASGSSPRNLQGYHQLAPLLVGGADQRGLRLCRAAGKREVCRDAQASKKRPRSLKPSAVGELCERPSGSESTALRAAQGEAGCPRRGQGRTSCSPGLSLAALDQLVKGRGQRPRRSKPGGPFGALALESLRDQSGMPLASLAKKGIATSRVRLANSHWPPAAA